MIANEFVDCSSNNPLPNLTAYAQAGHRGIMRKVTEGTGYRWYEGDQLAVAAHGHALEVGHYAWLRPDQDATAQARAFVAAVHGKIEPGDWFVTDFERTSGVGDPSDGRRAAQLRDFNRHVIGELPGIDLYVYTGNWYLSGRPACQEECRRWGVIMSDYSWTPKLPNPYGLHYVAWQFTDRARVAGFTAPVDLNRWLIVRGKVAAPPPVRPPTRPPGVHRPPTTTITEDGSVRIIIVDRRDCARRKVRWPGCFTTDGIDPPRHIATTARLRALRAAGFPVTTISFTDYQALGGK